MKLDAHRHVANFQLDRAFSLRTDLSPTQLTGRLATFLPFESSMTLQYGPSYAHLAPNSVTPVKGSYYRDMDVLHLEICL